MTTSFEKDTQGKVTKKIGNIRNSGMKSAANVGMSTPEERFETFRKLAKENNAEAQYRLSQCYLNGEGTEEDQIAYLYWLKEAAESGHADAQYEVSQLYYKGISINENEEKGMYWLRKAGENGSARAQFVLGGMHVNDDGEVQDADAFFYWMNKAAKSGFADAQYCLSLCYELGIGVEEDEQQHREWLRRAAEGGCADAQQELNELGEQTLLETKQVASSQQSLQVTQKENVEKVEKVDVLNESLAEEPKSGGFLSALFEVAKAVGETVTEVVNCVPLHDKMVGVFMLNKSSLSDLYKALMPSEISGKQWQNISAKLGNSVPFDTVIGFIDTTVFSSGKNGYLFTDDAVYFQDILSDPEVIPYDDIKSMEVIGKNKPKDSDRSLVFLLKDGSQVVWDESYVNKAAVRNLIDTLIALNTSEDT